jgi:hypothetical protein
LPLEFRGASGALDTEHSHRNLPTRGSNIKTDDLSRDVQPHPMATLTDEQRRALRLLARSPNGCTEAVMLKHGFRTALTQEAPRAKAGVGCLRREPLHVTSVKFAAPPVTQVLCYRIEAPLRHRRGKPAAAARLRLAGRPHAFRASRDLIGCPEPMPPVCRREPEYSTVRLGRHEIWLKYALSESPARKMLGLF